MFRSQIIGAMLLASLGTPVLYASDDLNTGNTENRKSTHEHHLPRGKQTVLSPELSKGPDLEKKKELVHKEIQRFTSYCDTIKGASKHAHSASNPVLQRYEDVIVALNSYLQQITPATSEKEIKAKIFQIEKENTPEDAD
ncbi:MAG: hypothetical protein FJX71_01640 [Alphaproteobacteria bacterium]|nr:hypothetical protein [Alphaproteobacteria bacterium]